MKKTRVFAYLRVSDTTNRVTDGFPRQEAAIKAYAKANNIEIVQTYREKWTGTTESRPVLAELMITLEKNGHGIKTVVIEKLDRLARDLIVQEAIIKDFQKQGFELVSTLEGSDLVDVDPSRKAIRQLFGLIAEYEKSMIVAKLKAARNRIKAKTGKCEGAKGYRDKEGWPEVLAHIEELRQRDEHGKRLTLQQVADKLNEEGLTTMRGLPWNVDRVHQTLHPLYQRKAIE